MAQGLWGQILNLDTLLKAEYHSHLLQSIFEFHILGQSSGNASRGADGA